MPRLIMVLLLGLFYSINTLSSTQEKENLSTNNHQTQASEPIPPLDSPLYSPFIERYILDELKDIRKDMAQKHQYLTQKMVDRELHSVDRGVTYATDAVTYFFYLIAGATSILVLAGWTSINDMKKRIHVLANERISNLIKEYEDRLHNIEHQLGQKTQHIEENREEIALTQEIQSLWLRAGQDNNPQNKISIYDQILKLRHGDCEALTYKADAVLELKEPQWAVNLCTQALVIDPENSHAFYQLGCAYTALGQFDEAVSALSKALSISESYREELASDPALYALKDLSKFQELLQQH